MYFILNGAKHVGAIKPCLEEFREPLESTPHHERCIKWDDLEIGIPWPIKEGVILSERGRKYPSLKQAEINFEY